CAHRGGRVRRSTRSLSRPWTSAGRPRRRVRLVGFFSSRCARFALRLVILPVPVTLKRLAAPRWVFIFGISRSSGFGRARCGGHGGGLGLAGRALGRRRAGLRLGRRLPAVLAGGV